MYVRLKKLSWEKSASTGYPRFIPYRPAVACSYKLLAKELEHKKPIKCREGTANRDLGRAKIWQYWNGPSHFLPENGHYFLSWSTNSIMQKPSFLCLGLISSNGACVYMKYEIMKMNVTRNANKHKEIFLLRDLIFAVNFNI